jgi:hypothetical protein
MASTPLVADSLALNDSWDISLLKSNPINRMPQYPRDIQKSEMGYAGAIDENPLSSAEQSADNASKALTLGGQESEDHA